MLNDPIYYSSATDLAQALVAKEISSVELLDVLISRVELVNPALNAVVCTDLDRAREEAQQADKRLLKGDLLGPLHGIPMTIKDSIDTEGIITTGGTIGRKNHVPTEDASVVKRLKNAGAIIFGKTNTPELTLSFETANEVYGVTLNPYDIKRSPGGSSGGAAAILASGGSPIEIGSDYGGSIRVPSAFCGTVGIKPTMGRVPRTGHIFPYGGLTDSFQQLGPMARNVEDLILLLDILSGPDSKDPAIVPIELGHPDRVDIRQLSIGYFATAELAPTAPRIQETIQDVAKAMSPIIRRMKEIEPVAFSDAYRIGMEMFNADRGAARERLLRQAGTITDPVSIASKYDSKELDSLITQYFDVRSNMLNGYSDYDIIISPANAGTAPYSQTLTSLDPFSYTIVHNVSGWPSAVIRCGTDEQKLPIGIQITAKPGGEDIVLATCDWLESEFGGFTPPGDQFLNPIADE